MSEIQCLTKWSYLRLEKLVDMSNVLFRYEISLLGIKRVLHLALGSSGCYFGGLGRHS